MGMSEETSFPNDPSPNPIAANSAVTEERTKVLEKHFPRDRVFPLVAYDLSTDSEEFTLFISLLESTFANSSTKVYWLKLALLTGVDGVHDEAKDEVESNEKRMLTLGYLSNAVGRLTIPVSDDWVELSSIDAREHYMAQFMQKVLCYICPLVKYREDLSFEGDLLYDVTVRNLSQSKEYREVEHVDDYGRSHLSRQTLQILCKLHGPAPVSSQHQFCVDDRIATFQCRLRLTRSTQFPFCPVQVHIRVEYRNCTSTHPQLEQRRMYRHEFLESVRATHLILRIQPDVGSLNLSTLIPIATFTFDKIVLKHLLKQEPELHDVIEGACENLSILEHYITRLINMLRLENTDDGPKYSLVGAFVEPTFTSLPWPEDIENQLCEYAFIEEEQPIPPVKVDSFENDSELIPPKPVIEEKVDEPIVDEIHNQEVDEACPTQIHTLVSDEDIQQSTPVSEIQMCPFHMVCDCQCHKCNLVLRGTPLRMFVDFGSILIDWSSEQTFRNSWDDIEELYVSVVDESGGQSQYWQDGHYVKGKVCILAIKNSVLDSVIEEFAWSFDDSSASDQKQLLELFISTLSSHLDLFKSETHQLLKLSAK